MAGINDVKNHLLKFGGITKLEAAQKYCEFNLGDKIMKLKRKGYHIETNMIPRPKKQAYALYILEREK